MRDREQVLSLRAVRLGERDEGAARVVEAAMRDLGELQIPAEALADLVFGAHRARLAVAVGAVAAA